MALKPEVNQVVVKHPTQRIDNVYVQMKADSDYNGKPIDGKVTLTFNTGAEWADGKKISSGKDVTLQLTYVTAARLLSFFKDNKGVFNDQIDIEESKMTKVARL